MPIRFKCSNCGKKLKAHDGQGGMEVLCSGCGQTLRVPEETAAPPAAAPSSTAPPSATVADITPPAAASPVASTAATAPASAWQRPVASAPAAEPPDSAEPEFVLAKRPLPDDEVDMTPMIDMTFLLLIFFMVTASFALQKSIVIPPPDISESASQSRAPEEPEEEDDYVQVQIKSDDTIWVGDSVAPSRQELISKLKEAREGGGDGSGQRNMMVMASDECHHEVLVMVMDAGTAAKMEKIRLAPSGEDDE
ncbi:MAG: ExbD/TolR family protein [Pirellulales bacterium]